MPKSTDDQLRNRLLENWQRAFPLLQRPFESIAHHEGVSEPQVLDTLRSLQAAGAISRVGGVVRPNTLGASTLATVATPALQAGSIATLLSTEPGINHIYLRENDWNLWFVVTGPDRAYVDRVLRRIEVGTGLRVLDLRLERPYHIDLGFKLSEPGTRKYVDCSAQAHSKSTYIPADMDRTLVQVLSSGLPLVPEPFAQLAAQLDCTQEHIIDRLRVLTETGIVPRIGVIVRHRALGWRSNAMVIWDVPGETIDQAGEILAAAPGINLCYQRKRYEREWPYNLYCMVHAKSREEAFDKLLEAEALAGLKGYPRQVLFSLRCYKQTGAMLAFPKEAA